MPISICNAFGSNCSPDWNGVGAVATAVATFAALSVPFIMASIERRKQQQSRKDVIHEVCSIVDRIVAYHTVGQALMKARFPYWPAIQSCEHISENVRYLRRSLEILIVRPELSDGTVIAAAAAEQVADSIVSALSGIANVQSDAEWSGRRARLDNSKLAADLASARSSRVRTDVKLQPSSSAAAILNKYNAVIAACNLALETQTAPVVEDISISHH
jgi:hypothetical protein